MSNEQRDIPDDLLEAFRNDVYVHNALRSYLNGAVDLVPALVAAVKAMHDRHRTMIDQLERCRQGQKPYWAGDNWTPPEEGSR